VFSLQMLPVTDTIETDRPPRTAAKQWFDRRWNYLRIETLSLAKSGPAELPRYASGGGVGM